MKFSDSFLDEIRTRLPVSQVVSRRVQLKKAGREWKGLSPFNKEKTPSFTVNDQKGFYHCFATGEHGDIFTFLMKTEGLSFPEAVSLLRPNLLEWVGIWGADPEVRRFAHEATEAYLADRNAVDASIAGTCMEIAAVDGDWKLYNADKQAFEEAQVPAERSRFLSAMGYFGNRSMQDAALAFTLSGELRPQELFTIPRGVGGMSSGEPDRMWTWFVANYDEIVELMPPQFKTYMPFFAGGCEEERLVAAREFFAVEEHQAPGQDRIMERVAEGVTECADLRRREGPSVEEFLVSKSSR